MIRGSLARALTQMTLLAFGLSLVIGVELAMSSGVIGKLLGGDPPWGTWALAGLMLVVGTSAFLNAFAAAIRPGSRRTLSTVALSALAITLGVEAGHQTVPLDPVMHFGIMLVGHERSPTAAHATSSAKRRRTKLANIHSAMVAAVVSKRTG